MAYLGSASYFCINVTLELRKYCLVVTPHFASSVATKIQQTLEVHL